MQALRRATTAGVFLLLMPAQAAQSPGEGDWITYNGSLSGDRYSPLREVTPANVGRLRPVCTFETSDTVSFQTGIVAVGGTTVSNLGPTRAVSALAQAGEDGAELRVRNRSGEERVVALDRGYTYLVD